MLNKFLEYELAPFPTSLFTENGLKKNVKSEFYKEFTSIASLPPSDLIMHVVDGGFLLHKVVWKKGETVEEIMKKYVNYVMNHFAKNSCIIFDGYPEDDTINSNSAAISASTGTKNAERQRRKNTVQVIPAFEYQSYTKIPFSQEKFLSNIRNKNKFIKTLSEQLQLNGFECKQAQEDADAEIVYKAIQKAREDPNRMVIIVGQDIDLLVLLNQFNETDLNIYFFKPGSGKIDDLYFTSNSFNHVSYKKYVAFLHCFSGCDTTSGFAGKGKVTTVKSLLSNPNLSSLADSFYNADAAHQTIAENGRQLIFSIYKSKKKTFH